MALVGRGEFSPEAQKPKTPAASVKIICQLLKVRRFQLFFVFALKHNLVCVVPRPDRRPEARLSAIACYPISDLGPVYISNLGLDIVEGAKETQFDKFANEFFEFACSFGAAWNPRK